MLVNPVSNKPVEEQAPRTVRFGRMAYVKLRPPTDRHHPPLDEHHTNMIFDYAQLIKTHTSTIFDPAQLIKTHTSTIFDPAQLIKQNWIWW